MVALTRFLALAGLFLLATFGQSKADIICAPIQGFAQMSHVIMNPDTGNTYTLDGRGCTIVSLDSDLGYFAAQGIVPPLELRISGGTPAAVINVIDHGAACDGATDDTDAINDALAAASVSYLAGQYVKVVGPSADTDTNRRCKVTNLNATGTLFRAFGSGGRLELANISLLCSGSVVCFDMAGSLNINMDSVLFYGDPNNIPDIGLQTANAKSTEACCIHSNLNKVQAFGKFTFAAWYNMGSESTSCFGCIFRNDLASTDTGPIGTLTLTGGGAGYEGGGTADRQVNLTGSATGSGAIAHAHITAGVIDALDFTVYSASIKGRKYKKGDVLSVDNAGTGSTGSGATATVSTIRAFAIVFDGENHWGLASLFNTITWPINSSLISHTQDNMFGGSARTQGGGAIPVWIAAGWGIGFERFYMLNGTLETDNLMCVELFDNGHTNNRNLQFNARCEVGPYGALSRDRSYAGTVFLLSGSNIGPKLPGFVYRDDTTLGQNVFKTEPQITSVLAQDIKIDLLEGFAFASGTNPPGVNLNTPMVQMFYNNAGIWSISGWVYVYDGSVWNAPGKFVGTLCHGIKRPITDALAMVESDHVCTTTGVGLPGNIIENPVVAWSCARKLVNDYRGPLCQIARMSDSTFIDIYPDANGDFSVGTMSWFCQNTSCKVRTLYDQSGNSNNISETTLTITPILSSSAKAGWRWGMSFTDDATTEGLSPASLSMQGTSTINNIFTNTPSQAHISIVYDETFQNLNADGILAKQSVSHSGWEYRYSSFNVNRLQLIINGTTNGLWEEASGDQFTRAHQSDVHHDGTVVSNSPTMGTDGCDTTDSCKTLENTTQVVAPGTDSGDLWLGNRNAPKNRAFPGIIYEVLIWKTTPGPTYIESIRRNQGAYYGLTNVD